MQMYLCIYVHNLHIYIHIHICVLGSGARFARAEAYGIKLGDYIMGLHYGIVSRIILRDNIM